uniref:Uncharacterized protein n=1 Tax=Anguilla anguilla TaxID=7936 RepID=A0A0E9WD35_ANGAN
MATEGFLVYIVLFLGSVHGQPESLEPDSDRKWIQADTPRIDSKAEKLGVHLVFLKIRDPILEHYANYFDSKKKHKTALFLKDSNGKTIFSHVPKVDLKNEKLKLTLVSHGRREVSRGQQSK